MNRDRPIFELPICDVCHKPVELKYQEWREKRIKDKQNG